MLNVYLSGLQGFIVERFGQRVWDEVVPEDLNSRFQYAKPEGCLTGELLSIFGLLADYVGQPSTELIKEFGCYLFPQLLDFMPEARQDDMSFRSFMISVGRVIHKDVQRLYPEVQVPKIDFIQQANQLTMFYRSERKLCYLAEGLIEGAADFFHAEIELSHPICMHHGAAYCEIVILIH